MNLGFDPAALLEPLSEESPCGENMEYSPEFTAMLAAAVGKPGQQVGDSVVAAVPPQWPEVVERCGALLERTRDLRVAARLAQALLHVHGLPGLGAGLRIVRGLVDRHWSDLHPRLDPDDGFDPAIRFTAAALLCNLPAVVHPLRDTTLLHGATGGAISLRHVWQARGSEACDDAARSFSAAEIDDAVASAATSGLRALAEDARTACAEARAIEETLSAHAGAAPAPDFEPLTRMLAEIDALASDWLARRAPEAEEPCVDALAPAADDPCAPAPAVAGVRTGAGPIASRDDALRALDDMCRYFRHHEPSHPVPILLARARRWLEMDFMDLLRDLAPEAVVEAEKLHGANRAH